MNLQLISNNIIHLLRILFANSLFLILIIVMHFIYEFIMNFMNLQTISNNIIHFLRILFANSLFLILIIVMHFIYALIMFNNIIHLLFLPIQ